MKLVFTIEDFSSSWEGYVWFLSPVKRKVNNDLYKYTLSAHLCKASPCVSSSMASFSYNGSFSSLARKNYCFYNFQDFIGVIPRAWKDQNGFQILILTINVLPPLFLVVLTDRGITIHSSLVMSFDIIGSMLPKISHNRKKMTSIAGLDPLRYVSFTCFL